MKIAVEGCCHGELDAIYDTVQCLEKKNNIKVDLLLICGDFQSVRNMADMLCMAVPPKHRQMNTFYKYYSGEKVAPVLTVFIGGNHEASNYLQELPYGGWVAPKIYYMGYAGVVQFGGVRIGGLSGIFKGKDYMKGHFEHPPYSEDSKRSAYHIRNLDVFRLKQIKQHVDIFLSHDWPRGIYKYGNVAALKKKKKFFIEEIEKDILGNPITADLLHLLQPDYWFSAHLHVKFPAIVQHTENDASKITKFLALDKCLPRRQFLQVIDIPNAGNQPMKLQLDAEWLAILKSTNHLLSLSRSTTYVGAGAGDRKDFTATEAEIAAVKADFGGELTLPENFQATVPAYDPNLSKKENNMPAPVTEINPQTTLLCSMLDLTDPNAVFLGKDSTFKLPDDADNGNMEGVDNADNDDDDEVDDDYDSEQSFVSISSSDQSYSFISTGNDSLLSTDNDSFLSLGNPEEISIDDEHNVNDDKTENKNISDEIDNSKKLNENSPQRMLKMGKRLSLSEKLKKCPPSDSGSGSDTAPSLNTSQNEPYDSIDAEFAEIIAAQKASSNSSQDELNDEAEFAEIMEAQKAASDSSQEMMSEDIESGDILNAHKAGSGKVPKELFSPMKSDSDSEIVDSRNSSSSLDCKSLEITDEDPEVQEMLNAQKQNKKSTCKTMEISAVSDDFESQEIVAGQKKNSNFVDNFTEGIDLDQPINQSSPVVTIEDKFDEDIRLERSGYKRQDTPKSVQSPASKKFKRRNQNMYVSEESTEEL